MCDWRLPPSPARWILGTWTFWHLDLTILTLVSPSFTVSPLSHAVHWLVSHQNPWNCRVPGSNDHGRLLWDQDGLTCTWESCNLPSGDLEGGKLLRNSCSTGFCLGKLMHVGKLNNWTCACYIFTVLVKNPTSESYLLWSGRLRSILHQWPAYHHINIFLKNLRYICWEPHFWILILVKLQNIDIKAVKNYPGKDSGPQMACSFLMIIKIIRVSNFDLQCECMFHLNDRWEKLQPMLLPDIGSRGE